MKEITVKAFEFDELSDSAKEKAREWYRRSSDAYNDWSESTIEEAVREAALMGIDIETRKSRGHCIWWSGFSSQGDGACFEGTWRASEVRADRVADGWGEDPATTEIKRIAAEFDRIAKAYPQASFTVKHRGHYSHENCTEFNFYSGADDVDCQHKTLEAHISMDDSLDDRFDLARQRYGDAFPKDDLKEAAKSFMRWIHRQLEKEYEYQNSDERVDENIRANDYLFSEEGNRTVVL